MGIHGLKRYGLRPYRLMPDSRFRPENGRKHLFQNHLVLVLVNKCMTDTDKNVVSGTPDVSTFINDRPIMSFKY